MKLLKHIAVITVLLAFLLSASGVMLFMHHCQSMETTEVSIDGTNSCCPAPTGLFRTTEHNDCSIEHHGNCTHHAFLTKQSCCTDGRLFVKIGSDYLTTFYKTLQPNLTAIEATDNQSLTAVSLTEFITPNTARVHDPPGREIYLRVSSLRL